MEFRVLGPVEVWAHSKPAELGSTKERIVLAALALNVNRPVPLDRLVAILWEGEELPRRPRESTHTYVSRLRKHLRLAQTRAGADGDDTPRAVIPQIVGRSHTYELKTSTDNVDWHRFQRLAKDAKAETDAVAVQRLLNAEAIWHGEALAGLPGRWAESVRHSLSEHRLSATVNRTAAQLRLGQFAPLIGELPALVEQHPLNETLLAHLTLAYYGCGRFSESLQVQQSARQILWKEYGARPGPELDRLHQGILQRVPAARLVQELTAPGVAPTITGHAPVRTGEPQPDHVPSTLPTQHPLVGRTSELAFLSSTEALPPDGSVILLETVSGMPGVGKTALAVHTANQLSPHFPDGQLYLDLRAHSRVLAPMSTEEALTELLRMLGAPAGTIPTEPAGRVSLWRAMMAERRAVVVLDDAAGSAQVKPLLPDRSPSLVIITSRRHLVGIAGTRSLSVDILPVDDAVALFRSFAGESRCTDHQQVAEIVNRCGLLPLAIELVANRLRTRPSWTLATLRERLTRSQSRLAEIHDTETEVTKVFEMSYRTLTPLQRTAFRHLGLHPGPDFTPEVAATMLGLAPSATERVLEELLACHLLGEPTPDRYRFHDLIREFARLAAEREDDTPVRNRVLHRITRFYLLHAEQADRVANPRRMHLVPLHEESDALMLSWDTPASAAEWLARERANLLATIEDARANGFSDLAARLGYALTGFLDAECHWHEATGVLQHAVSYWSANGPAPFHCRALLHLAVSHTNIGNYPEADEAVGHALDIARATSDSEALGEAWLVLGTLVWNRGDSVQALKHYERALAIKEASGNPYEIARVHSNIGVTLLNLSKNDQALLHFGKAIAGFKECGALKPAAVVLNNTGDMHLRNGDIDAARSVLEESLAFFESAGNRYVRATARVNLADVLMKLGHVDEALNLYQETLDVFQQLGDRKSRSEALIGIGEAHRASGELRQAVVHFQKALAIARAIGAANQEVQALRCIGRVEFSLAQLQSAAEHLRSAAATAIRIRDLGEIFDTHTLLADVLVASGDTAQAASVLHTAAAAVGDQDVGRAEMISRRLAELSGPAQTHEGELPSR